MELVLLRHGKAEDGNPGGDFARRLTEKGWLQARRAGELLKAAGRAPDVVLTSPRVRARETAEGFCEACGLDGPLDQGWLDCGMTPAVAMEELAAFAEFGRVMIVGHEPDFSDLAETLAGAAGGRIEVKKGALVGLQTRPPAVRGELRFLVPPKLVGG